MKLQKHFAKKLGNKNYYKNVVVIPDKIIKQAGFKQGDELEAEVTEKGILLKKAK